MSWQDYKQEVLLIFNLMALIFHYFAIQFGSGSWLILWAWTGGLMILLYMTGKGWERSLKGWRETLERLKND